MMFVPNIIIWRYAMTQDAPSEETQNHTNGSGDGAGSMQAKFSSRTDPQEVLPTDRIAFEKQLLLLLAYAAASDSGQKTVGNEDIASLVEMNSSTVSLANTFFTKIGFLARSGREFIPAKEVIEYKIASEWDKETAPFKLAPIIEKSWFIQTLKPKLQMRAIEESEAIHDLAQKAAVGKDRLLQIRMLLNYALSSGVIRKEADRLYWNKQSHEPARDEMPHRHQDQQGLKPAPLPPQQQAAPVTGQDGAIHFNVSVNISMEELSKWPADRLTAFFTGLAQVISAKGEREGK